MLEATLLPGVSHLSLDRNVRPYPRRLAQVARSVLIVDDNAFVRKALCEMFKREEGFDVCGEAENGREAIAKAQELRPDLIVLDLSMPVMNGFDAARVLKRLMPAVILIIYSAFGDRYVEHQARLIGVAALISKAAPPPHSLPRPGTSLRAPPSLFTIPCGQSGALLCTHKMPGQPTSQSRISKIRVHSQVTSTPKRVMVPRRQSVSFCC
jgi:two-component system chemotaxis response regulator CheY